MFSIFIVPGGLKKQFIFRLKYVGYFYTLFILVSEYSDRVILACYYRAQPKFREDQ